MGPLTNGCLHNALFVSSSLAAGASCRPLFYEAICHPDSSPLEGSFAAVCTQGGSTGLTRPVIVCLVLLLLFLSMQAEWAPSSRKTDVPKKKLLATSTTQSSQGEGLGVREKIVKELAISNERLEIENELLRQTVLDLRRAMRECNCTSPGVELYSDQLGPNLRLLPKFTQSAASDENEASAESGRHDRAFGFGSLQAESIVSEAAGQTSRTTEPQASGASTEAAVVSIKPNRERSDQLHGGAESTSSSLQSQGSLAEQSLASQELSVARNRHEPQRHGAQDRLEAAQSEAFSD
ncbi:hypothetical protein WJX84_001214 [Apatococcus fuscideae]|uniref:Uncharacterized protein n=1 Tax=Apatococcus fuscideae TaxID=2026836 RepID=A0AAW1T7H1_9CHLO